MCARWPGGKLPKAEPNQIGNAEVPARIVGCGGEAGVSDVADRICALITIAHSVGSSADTDGIHHQDQGTHIGSVVAGCGEAAGANPVLVQ